MVELNYKTIDAYLNGLKRDRNRKDAPHDSRPAQVYLIYGEEVLCKAAFKKLLDTLVPVDRHRFNYEPVDDATGGVYEAIEKLNTFSLLSGPKVVGLLEPRLFDSGPDAGRILRSARQAHAAGNMSRAAADLLRFMALSNLTFEDLSGANRQQGLRAAAELLDDDGWLDDILAFCQANGRVVPPPADSESALCRALEKGFPAGNHLLITVDTIDKRKKLFKMIRELGVVVDCSVPTGDRKSDKKIQEAVLLETMNAVLAESGKSIDRDAFTALQEMTGFNIRAFTVNVEKLVNFVGDRPQITRSDIVAALQRTKKDPVYALTGAVAARNLEDALFYLSTLMSEGLDAMRPEQILVAILNQIQKTFEGQRVYRRLVWERLVFRMPFQSVYNCGHAGRAAIRCRACRSKAAVAGTNCPVRTTTRIYRPPKRVERRRNSRPRICRSSRIQTTPIRCISCFSAPKTIQNRSCCRPSNIFRGPTCG